MQEKTKVLIVDDEPVNLDFFEVMLGKLGFEVETASHGEEALERLEDFFPDLIILDNVMPKMSGWQVTRLLKNDAEYERFRNIPIIMFSAMDDVRDKVEGFELGVEDYITKPFNFSEVLARIRAVLRGQELYKQLRVQEKKQDLAEYLYRTFTGFLDELKEPIEEIEQLLVETKDESSEKVRDFIEKVRLSVERLEGEIGKIDQERLKDAKSEEVLKNLDDRMRAHFAGLKDNEDTIKEVNT
jgi:DNA-binding response OmpR family regulator